MAGPLDIAAAADEVVASLRSAGLRATVEPAEVNPPAAWVTARTMAHNLLGGGGTVAVDVYLIAPDTGTGQALRTLSSLLDKALTVLDPDADTSLAEAVTLPGGGAALPAFRVTVNHETC